MATREFYSYTVLDEIIAPDHWRRVVRRALEHRPRSNTTSRATLDVALRRNVSVKGFPTPLSAPIEVLAAYVVAQSWRSPDVVRGTLMMWSESYPQLQRQLRSFLDTRHVAVLPHNLPHQGLPMVHAGETLEALADEFLSGTPVAEQRADVVLLLCCLTGRLPQPALPSPPGAEPEAAPAAEALEPRAPELQAPGPQVPGAAAEDAGVDLRPAAAPHAAPDAPEVEEEPGETLLPAVDESIVAADPAVAELRSALNELRREYPQALGLLDGGDLSALANWADTYATAARQAALAFFHLRGELRHAARELAQSIAHDSLPEDEALFRAELETIQAGLSGGLEEHVDAQAGAVRLRTALARYRQRRAAAQDALRDVHARAQAALDHAASWQADVDARRAALSDSSFRPASLRVLERGPERIEKLALELEAFAEGARHELATAQLERCGRLRAQIEAAPQTARTDSLLAGLAAIETELRNIPDDLVLHGIPGRLSAIEIQVPLPGHDISETAAACMRERNPAGVAPLLSALWRAGRTAEGFILLTAALHASRWPAGESLPEGGLANYFQGLVDLCGSDQLAPAGVDVCTGGMLTSLLRFERPDEQLGMTILCTSLLLAYREAFPGEILQLWKARDTGNAHLAPGWLQLADGIKANDWPAVIFQYEADRNDRKKIAEQLNAAFRRSGSKSDGNPAGSAGPRLLAQLEQHWRELQEVAPAAPRWTALKRELAAVEPEALLQGEPDRAQRLMAERLRKIVDGLRAYVAAREEEQNPREKRPVIWERLWQELQAVKPSVGAPLVAVCEAATRTAMEAARNGQVLQYSFPSNSLAQRISRAVLAAGTRQPPFAPATAWLAHESLSAGGAWEQFFEALLAGLALPPEGAEWVEMYMQAGLPCAAALLAETCERPADAARAAEACRHLNQEVAERRSQLEELRAELGPLERMWLEQGRFPLLLQQLDERIQRLRARSQQVEGSQRQVMREMLQQINDLDRRVFDTQTLPEATRRDADQALLAVRNIVMNKEAYRLDAAREVLDEVRHLLDDPAGSAAGLESAIGRLAAVRARGEAPLAAAPAAAPEASPQPPPA